MHMSRRRARSPDVGSAPREQSNQSPAVCDGAIACLGGDRLIAASDSPNSHRFCTSQPGGLHQGAGNSTPSQTAWIDWILAGADPTIRRSRAPRVPVQHKIQWFLERRDFTGTASAFFIEVSPLQESFPVYALARYRNQASRAQEYCAVKFRRANPCAPRPVYGTRAQRFRAKQCGIPSG